jgi:hypothetical protein
MLKKNWGRSLARKQQKATNAEIDALLLQACTKLSQELKPSIMNGSDKYNQMSLQNVLV